MSAKHREPAVMAVALWSAALRALMDLRDFSTEHAEESAAARELFTDHRDEVAALMTALAPLKH